MSSASVSFTRSGSIDFRFIKTFESGGTQTLLKAELYVLPTFSYVKPKNYLLLCFYVVNAFRGGSRNYSEGCSNLRLRNQGCCYAQTLNPLLIGHNEMKVCHKLKSLDALILFSNFLLHFDQNSELWLKLFMEIERNLHLPPLIYT